MSAMNPNHTITMTQQQMQLQRRPYSRGAVSRNNRMQRLPPFMPQQQQQHNPHHRNGNPWNNGNKDMMEQCYNTSSHG